MAKYELTDKQVENMRAFLMDANIKGSAAVVVVELMQVLDHPVDEVTDSDLHGKHNDKGKKTKE